MPAEGTHELSDEQRAEMEALYGVSYRHVETGVHGVGVNRAARRKSKRKAKR